MPRRVADSSYLISFWRSNNLGQLRDENAVREKAREFQALYRCEHVLTPVVIEMLAGVMSNKELKYTRAFLDEFEVADKGKVTELDWKNAKVLAERFGAVRKPRQLGDCLIKAIADRIGYDVDSGDLFFS